MVETPAAAFVRLAVLGLAGAAAVPFFAATAAAADEHCTLEAGPTLAVVRVLDGETIALGDGSEVRLIGALAPRKPDAISPVTDWPPERAAREALAELVEGRSVELRFAGRRTDRWGRRLAHAFLESSGTRIWVQGYLLSHGHARAFALPGSTACLADMLAAERQARERRLGLWANPAYGMKEAQRTDELLARRLRFEIVEGRIESVAGKAGRVYLNFGRDWRRDFTVSVPPRLLRAVPEAKARLAALTGTRVRVRGWIERRNGPMVELSALEEIEEAVGR